MVFLHVLIGIFGFDTLLLAARAFMVLALICTVHRPEPVQACKHSPGQCVRSFGHMYETAHAVMVVPSLHLVISYTSFLS